MIKNEISEIKRRWKSDYNAISTIYGYYVNANKDIISSFDTSLGLMEPSEVEIYLSVLKKTLSGSIGRNLIDISFTVAQVENSSEHQLLMKLRDSEMKDAAAREELVEKIVPNVSFDEDNFLILMAFDAYDMAYRDANLEDMDDGGSEVFKYFLCCVCPVKPPKLNLQYNGELGEFHSMSTGQVAAAPELGFMFPSFDDRTTNLYNALFYTKKPANTYQEVIDEVFHYEKPLMSAVEQMENFQNVIAESLEEECSFEIVRALNEQVRAKIESHKEEKNPENLVFSPDMVGEMLSDSGVSTEKVEKFNDACEERFGKHAVLQPVNILETKKFTVETPDVKITVPPDKSYLVKTQLIDGQPYILIPAADGVVVNGLNIIPENIESKDEETEF